jgi:nucleotide-binding universal stress UspA family protein
VSIKTILVATDFSDHSRRAFEVAISLARQLGARLYLVHVQNESSLRTAIKESLLTADSTDEELEVLVAELNEKRFSEMLAHVDHSGVEVNHVNRRGDSEPVIADYAKETGAQLLVVGRRGAGLVESLRSSVLGSVAESLVRRAPCPVLVVRLEHQID